MESLNSSYRFPKMNRNSSSVGPLWAPVATMNFTSGWERKVSCTSSRTRAVGVGRVASFTITSILSALFANSSKGSFSTGSERASKIMLDSSPTSGSLGDKTS